MRKLNYHFFTFLIFALSIFLSPISQLINLNTVYAEESSPSTIEFTVDASFSLPSKLDPLEEINLPISISNIGSNDILASEVNISAKWTQLNSGNISYGEDISLVSDIIIGQNSDPSQQIVIKAPASFGGYELKIVLRKISTGEYFESPSAFSVSVIEPAQIPIGQIEVDRGELASDGVDLQAQDNNLKIYLDASSNIPITDYIIGTSQSYVQNSENWINFDNDINLESSFTPIATNQDNQLARSKILEYTIPDETGFYSFYVKYRATYQDKNDETKYKESEVYFTSVYYKNYEITPLLELGTSQALLGGEIVLGIDLSNQGNDIGYNAGFEITLPTDFQFIEALEYKEGDKKLTTGGQSPTFISINTDGKQILVYEGIADLLPGEKTSVHLKVKVGGLNEGYKLGDLVNIDAKGQLFKRSNFKTGFEVVATHEIELKPFVVDYEGNEGEQLVEEVIDNNVTIEVNPEIDADAPTAETPNPVVVEFELENGQSYLDGSQQVLINGVPADVVFQLVEVINNNPILKWMFGEVNASDVIEIFFQTQIDKIEEEDITGINFVDHNQELESILNVDGNFSNPIDSDCVVSETEDCLPDSQTYSETETKTIIAKYFKVDKWANPFINDINSTIRYTIRIETSKQYDLSGIEVTDILPDGVTFNQSTANIESDPSLNLLTQSKSNETGETTLVWRINSVDGIPSGTVYEFSYDVKVNSNYDVKQLTDGDSRLLARDNLTSLVTLKGIWTDTDDSYVREETIEERTKTDSASAGNRMHIVNFEDGIKLATGSSYIDSVDAKIGDIFDVYAYVTFPQNIPTNEFNYRTYLPVGTKLVDGSLQVTATGTFSKDPTTSQKIEGGYLFELGKVEPNATFRIDYQIQVQDDANLKEAVVVRNLFRADYTNIDNNKFTYRNDVTLSLIEPRLEISKSVINGYLARGEEATIEVKVKNIGTDSAFGINISDLIPSNTTLIDGTVTLVGNTTYTLEDDKFIFEEFNLNPEEEIVLTYKVITDSDVIFAYDIDSTITVSQYLNRSDEDTLPARNYLGGEYEYNWNANEPLLVTLFNNLNPTRDEVFNLEAIVKPVGNAPVYNNQVVVDVSSVGELTADINAISYKVLINDVEQVITTTNITDGAYTFENIDLGANDILKIIFELKVPKFSEFGKEYPITLEAIGLDKLGDGIRKDGSNENANDTDNDDKSEEEITTVRKASGNYSGEVKILINGEEKIYTNRNSVDSIEYSISSDNEVIAVRFSNDGANWFTYNDLPNLEDDKKPLLGITGEWDSWSDDTFINNCEQIDSNCELLIGGRNYRYIQAITLQNEIRQFHSSIIKDTTAPISASVFISPFEGDISNTPSTSTFNNYINFSAQDFSNLNGYSNIGEYAYSFDGIDWSDWQAMTSGLNTRYLTFPTAAEGENLEIHLKVRDNAGNEIPASIYDSIEYDKEYPIVTIDLNNGEEFTNNTTANITLDIIDSNSGVNKIRFNQSDFCDSDVQSCLVTEWIELDRTNLPTGQAGATSETWQTELQRIVNRNWIDGKKQICVELMDSAANVSNKSCDTITLDRSAPTGFIMFNNGALQTNGYDTILKIDAVDPELPDESNGSGNVQMRFSYTGQNCDEENTPEAKENCEQNFWTTWENFTDEKSWRLEEYTGIHTVYMQLIDGAGNKSIIYSDDITYNPYQGTGNIIINNNDLFTNTKFVTLNLNADISGFECEGCTQPLLMRFSQTSGNDLPSTPPVVSSPNDDQEGWSYWEEYTSGKQWDLDKGNIGKPNYGLKNVFVQYMLPNTETTQVYNDSIIYAPYYGIEYQRDATWNVNDSANKTYGLGNIPINVISQDQFTIKLNTKNTGSFTWPVDGENPVRISYTWRRTGGDPIDGSFGGEGNYNPNGEQRGNSVILPENISWNKLTGELTLKVGTPLFPGQYELKIDAVHEGQAWFSEYGNEAPKFSINVSENPDKVTPIPGIDPETGEVLGLDEDLEFGIGGSGGIPFPTDYRNCADYYGQNWAGTTCYIGGILQRASDARYDYQIWGQETNNPNATHKFHFIPGVDYDNMLGQEVLAQVYYHNNSHQFWINWMGVAPKSWISEYHGNLNDSQLLNPIVVNKGMNIQIQPRLLNGGTAIWYSNEVTLVSISKPLNEGGVEVNSPFKDSSWKNNSRVSLDYNPSGYGFNSVGRFTFNLNIPESISFGTHRQCFVTTNDPYRDWIRRDTFCLTIEVRIDYEEEREFVCSTAQEVYIEKSTSSTIIGYLNQNDKFVVTEDHGDWIKGYLPTSGESGWIERPDGTVGNNYDCFDNVVKIDKPIPAPVFNVIPQPTGDTGYIINLSDIPVKDGPADSFNTITTISYGTEVQVLGEANLSDRFGGWLYVRVDKSLCEEIELTTGNCEGWIPKGTVQHINNPPVIQVSFKPDYVKAHICGDNKQVRRGPGSWYPLAKPSEVGDNFNFAIIMLWTNSQNEKWYHIYLDDDETGPNNLNTGWIKGLEEVCEGIYAPVFDPACSGELAWPYEQQWPITSGWRSPRKDHEAIDIGAPLGTPVLASADGYISFAGADKHGGLYVDVIHPQLGVKTRYLHLSYIDRFSGNIVKGQQIGLTGSTGLSTGPHLHFGVFDLATGIDVNPLNLLGGSSATACNVSDDLTGIETEDLYYADYSDDDIAEELMDEMGIDSSKILMNWNIDKSQFPASADYKTVIEKYTLDNGIESEFTLPEVNSGQRDEYLGLVTFINPTNDSVDLSDLSFLSMPQHWIYKNFFLEDTETGQKYYFNDYSKAPSWWAGNVGEFFLDLKDPFSINNSDLIKSYYFRGTIKRLVQTNWIFSDDTYPEKGEYFYLETWGETQKMDMNNSDRYFNFKIGDHINEESDLEYAFDADTFWNDVLPNTACFLGSIAFTGGTALALCIALPGAKIISQGYVAPEDAINIGSELLFFGGGKLIKMGFKSIKTPINNSFKKLISEGVETGIAKETTLEASNRVIQRELAQNTTKELTEKLTKEGFEGLSKEVSQEVVENGTKNVIIRMSEGVRRQADEVVERGLTKVTEVVRPTPDDVSKPLWQKVMGKSYSSFDNLPKTPANSLPKGIIFDGASETAFYEMKNYTAKVGLTYQIRLEIFTALSKGKNMIFITPNGTLDDLSKPLQKLILEVNQSLDGQGYRIIIEKFIVN